MNNDSKKKPVRGKDSFHRIVLLKPGHICHDLKNHYKFCAYEVVGYLNSLAAMDAERFVWPSVPTIVTKCNKGKRKGKKPYGRRIVNYTLSDLCRDRILTPTERVRGGALRQGWIMAPHDAVTMRNENGDCDLLGQQHW